MSRIAEEQRIHYDLYHSTNWIPRLEWESPSLAFAHRKYWSIVQDFLSAEVDRSGAQDLSILDAGCGDGSRLLTIANQMKSTARLHFTGLDISAVGTAEGKQMADSYSIGAAEFVTGEVENTPFDDKCFDIVISTEVVEHLADPGRALKEFHRILKPGGAAIIGTQNRAYVFERIGKRLPGWAFRKMAGRKYDGEIGSDYWEHAHPSEMTWREFRAKLQQNGFKLEAVRGGALISEKPWADKHGLLLATALVFDALFDRLRMYPDFQYSMIAYARKAG
jgi:ubiquinone/menaquinone biosynthesis C-methylase UbiE